MRDNVRSLPRRIPDPWTWAWALWAYQRREGLDDKALAAELGMPATGLGTRRSLTLSGRSLERRIRRQGHYDRICPLRGGRAVDYRDW